MAANGADPKAGVQSAGVTNLCNLTVETNFLSRQGTDYAFPLLSKYYASTKGVDNLCDTADDGQAAITFSTAGKPVVTAVDTSSTGSGPVVATLRDPVTLRPAQAVNRRGATSVIDVSLDLLIAEQNGVLTIVASDGKTFTPSSTITAGGGWQSAGFDANNFYAYRNSAPLSSLPSSN